MSDTFGQAATPVGTLRGILNRYPYSIGQLREILQNSEDAGATKQVFTVDRRRHPSSLLYHQGLTPTQGPALLAYNDAEFIESDWHALQYAYESSKTDDSSKIGKYGVGFRSLFHITDCPQIVSGNTLAMFDPLCVFTGSAGLKKDLTSISSQHPDQLTPFQAFLPPSSGAFKGTIIRCPLRTIPSRISSKVVHPDDITQLFREFITEELSISLLFLRNIQRVEFHEIDEHDVSSCVATLSVSRSPATTHGLDGNTHILTTTTTSSSSTERKVEMWRILQCPFSQDEAIQLVSRSFTGDATQILRNHKLSPNVGIAVPIDPASFDKALGQLFTYLPLPITTGFPVHIHALFAIEDSRQHLVNSQTKGIMSGSDHQLVNIWNHLLFKHYVARAWKLLLEILVQTNNTVDIFDIWPPAQGSPTSGEGVYWKLLPECVFESVTSSKTSVWPLYKPRLSPTSMAVYKSLDLLISADPNTPRPVLDALIAMGLQLTCPPAYIHDLVKKSDVFLALSPEVAHDALLGRVDELRKSSKQDQTTVLEYLLSNRNVRNIIDLPLIPVVSGRVVALSAKGGAQPQTMLNKVEHGIFGACDDDAVPLESLPIKVAETLIMEGPQFLNVETLSVSHIINYLTIYPNKLGLNLSLVRTDQRAIQWLSAFWIWMNTYAKKEELFTKIRHLYLLPSTQGLRKAGTPLFKSLGMHPNSVTHLSSLGIPFLDADMKTDAQSVIASHHLLKQITDIHALLDFLPSSGPPLSASGQSLSQSACTTVLRHLAAHAPGSKNQHGAFSVEQIRRLKNMPMFPMATFLLNSTGLVVKWAKIPDGLSLRSIENPPFLPVLPDVAFMKLDTVPSAILDLFESSPSRHLSDVDVLSLTVDNFISQPDYVQAAALGYLVQHRNRIPPIVAEKLRGMKFVAVMDESKQIPMDVVAPKSKLVPLYDETPARQARESTASEKKIIHSLQNLGMLRQFLTTPIAQERINFISQSSSPKAIDISRSLLTLIINSRFDCSELELTSKQRWLPTNKGLRGSTECRDATTRPYLFDQVLATMDTFEIPSSLKHALGWDEPLSREVLIKQLGRVLDGEGDIFMKVYDIIKELSVRACNATDFVELKKVTAGKKWVPTTERQLAETQNSVYLTPIPESGFHQVLSLDKKMREFLDRMGCTERPTTQAVIANLKALRGKPTSLDNVNVSLNLLRSLPAEFENAEREQFLVPDTAHQLRPLFEVYFNDIGNHASLVSSGADYIAHDLLEESLARKLGMSRLGLKYVDFSVAHVDMGADLVTTVRNNLEQYKDKQFATEFLANAVDANATEFTLVVNEFHPPQDENIRALSADMASFCSSPSLVVYNNATFTDADFIGIRRTGIGGKGGKGNTIGQFGLGVLTMFHFTEIAILISNSNVLFLNPSKMHLPIRDQASLMLPLNRVRRYYPSHLACIDGLFGFDISSEEPYVGTIFILPLRDTRHFEGTGSGTISQRIRTADDVHNLADDFKASASDCLLFTKIERIQVLHRSSSANLKVVWSFFATRTQQDTEPGTEFSTAEVRITDTEDVSATWRTVKRSVLKNEIPQDIITPILADTPSRPRIPAMAGLAVLLQSTDTPHKSQSRRFFSTLPLSVSTSLPVHVMATFLLSSDRRNIRLDDHGIQEAKFNTWLLSNIIPPLYLFLLQRLLERGDNKQWWPAHHRDKEDAYSRLIIDAFYSVHLKASNRPILYSVYDTDNVLTPQESVLSGVEPPCVERVLSTLRSRTVARPSKGVFQLLKKSGISVVGPEFVKSEILQAPPDVLSQVSSKDIEETILYLLGEKTEAAENLHELPILPLENGTLATFQSRTNDHTSNVYVWMPQKPSKRHNFPVQYFVHPNLKRKLKDTLVKIDVNVIPLNPDAVKMFIAMKFPHPFSSPFEASSEISDWVDAFWESWEEYNRLGLLPDHISEFPLVPTVRPNSFVSLASCRNISSLLVGGTTEQFELIRLFLDNLGLSVVRLSDDLFPPLLIRIIRDGNYPPFNLENVLKALGSGRNSISETIHGFDDDLQTAFASWARSNISQTFPPELEPVAQQLPLWTAGRRGSTQILPATEVYMLPEGLPLGIAAPFMNVYVADYGSLRFLNGQKLSYEQLHDRLVFPDILPFTDLQCYHQLLDVWLPRLPTAHTLPVCIPDCNLTIRLSDSLYSRDPLFETVFGANSPLFIHPELQQLETALYKHGLRTESQLDVTMFIECVQALESMGDEDMDDKVTRAAVLFEAYGVSLPMRIGPNDQDLWRDLDDYCFIPRDMATRRLLPEQDHRLPGIKFPDNVTALERIVTPLDLVREEFESIAWTQRARFASPPNQRVTVAYPDLGRPSVSEVTAHIRVLSQMENLSFSQRQIILHDVEESYGFLNDNSTAGDSVISLIGGESLFLNVDDPDSDVWRWDKAEQLVFEKQDINADIRHVRGFLLPFKKLLRAAGAMQVHHPQYPATQTLDTPDTRLQFFRSGFQRLRESRALTDVVFIANEEEINMDPLVAHRSFLAVCSDYFYDRFSGGFTEAKPASSDNPIECDVSDHSHECVRSILDYIYKGDQPAVEDLSIELVLDILQLASYWRISDLFEDIQREISSKLLKPQLIKQIKTSAETSGADKLYQTCLEYEDKNEALMRKLT